MRIDKMDDRWMDDKADTSDVSRWYLLTTNDEGPIAQLSHVLLPGLRFLQGDDVLLDVPCSVEKSVKVGVCGDCSGVVSAEHEAVSTAGRRRCAVFVQTKWRPEQPATSLVSFRRLNRGLMTGLYSFTCCSRFEFFPQH